MIVTNIFHVINKGEILELFKIINKILLTGTAEKPPIGVLRMRSETNKMAAS